MKPLRLFPVAPLVLGSLVLAIATLAGAARPLEEEPHPLAWLEGHWLGEGFGGVVEETWLPARGGAMLGVFRMLHDDRVTLYELVTIEPAGLAGDGEGGLVMRLKHFDADLAGWEPQKECLVWEHEPLEGRRARFGPVAYDGTEEGVLRATVEVSEGGEERTEELVFRRVE